MNFEPDYTKSGENGQVTHLWSVENLAALRNESLDLPADKIIPQILVAPTLYEAAGNEGDMSDW